MHITNSQLRDILVGLLCSNLNLSVDTENWKLAERDIFVKQYLMFSEDKDEILLDSNTAMALINTIYLPATAARHSLSQIKENLFYYIKPLVESEIEEALNWIRSADDGDREADHHYAMRECA